MNILYKQWEIYRAACYPQGLPKEQETECSQAFFAGALVVLKVAVESSENKSPEQAYSAIASIIKEAETLCRNRVYAAKSRN